MRITLKGTLTRLAFAFINIFFVAVCLSAYGSVCLGQSTDDNLLQRRVSLRVKDGTMVEALDRLSGEASVPIGWEVTLNDFVRHDINVNLKNTALKDVLDFLMIAEPSYRWKLEDGVINVIPAVDRDDLLEKLLSLRIKQFDPPRGLYVFAFRDAILEIPEVYNFLQTHGLEASHTAHMSGAMPPPLDFEFRVADTELRALLNKLIRDRHRRMWILSRSGERRQLLHLAL
jgi:hypothetical protein